MTEQEPVRVTPAWLDLREPADAAARATDLVDEVRRRLPVGGPVVVHDLGCGTGSMARWLAPRLAGPQHWVMYDRDADLLAHARAQMPPVAADGAAVTVETRQSDITRLEHGELAGASLITASALLDMLTADGTCPDRRCLYRRRLSGAADHFGDRSRRVDTARPAGRVAHRRVQRPPAPSRRRPATARTRRSRRGGRGLRPSRCRRARAAQPLAPRRFSRAFGGRVAHRLGRRGMRATSRIERCRPRLPRSPPGRRIGRPAARERAPPGPARDTSMRPG